MSFKRSHTKNSMQLAMEAAAKKKGISLETHIVVDSVAPQKLDRLSIIRDASHAIDKKSLSEAFPDLDKSEDISNFQIPEAKNLRNENPSFKPQRNKKKVAPRNKIDRFEDDGVVDAYHPGGKKIISKRTDQGNDINRKIIHEPGILFTKETRISKELLTSDFSFQMAFDFSFSSRDQVNPVGEIDADVVMGIDWGTTYTKVIIQELGSRKAYAVKFGGDGIEGYLLPSQIYKNEDAYEFKGPDRNLKKNLKLPILSRSYNVDDLSYIIAFLAIVIRNSREWFLINHESSFSNIRFAWSYHIGIPAVSSDNELSTLLKNILHSAAAISLNKVDRILHSDVLRAANIVEKGSWCDEDRLLDEYYISAFPEVSAQLHGYVNSNKWDSSLPKVMIIDIGGGTVDSAIINVTKSNSEVRYNCLKSHVFNCGAEILHLFRQDWIKDSFLRSRVENPMLLKEIDLMRKASGKLVRIPSSVTHYLSKAVFAEGIEYSVDTKFDRNYATSLWANIMAPAQIIDPKTDWSKLKLLFCGGASNNKLYQRYIHTVNSSPTRNLRFNLSTLEAPESLDFVGVGSSDYHRLSVAYGLSFQDLGKFVRPDEIPPIPYESMNSEPSKHVEYISKDLV